MNLDVGQTTCSVYNTTDYLLSIYKCPISLKALKRSIVKYSPVTDLILNCTLNIDFFFLRLIRTGRREMVTSHLFPDWRT